MYRSTIGERIFDSLNIIFLLSFGFCTLYPFWYMLTISLSTPADFNRLGLQLFPLHPTWAAYGEVLSNARLYHAYGNTIIRTLLGMSIVIFFTSLMAYPLAQKKFPLRSLIMKLIVFSLLFNGGLIPTYMLVKNLGLIDTLWALVLPGAVSGFYVIVMRNFIEAIPVEIIESVKIDGASEGLIWYRIVLPLSLPVIAVIALWSAVGHWNAWFDAMIYTNDARLEVLQLYLRRVVIEQTDTVISGQNMIDPSLITPKSLKAALIILISLPIIAAYPFIQRFFTKGIMLGSVKG